MHIEKLALSVPGSQIRKANSRTLLRLIDEKAFVKEWLNRHPRGPYKQAYRAFDEYRLTAIRDLSHAVGLALLKGNISIDRVSSDINGNVRLLSAVRIIYFTANELRGKIGNTL